MAIVARSALGLDLGSHAVKAVALRQTLRGIEVLGMHAMPAEDPDDARPFGERLRTFLRMHQLPTESVLCALPGDRLASRHLHFPFRDRRRLAAAIPLAVEDELPFDLDDMLLDWERVAGDRERSEVVATVAPRAEVAQLLARCAEAGLAPRTVEAEGLLLGNLAGALPDALDGVRAVVDLGHRKTTLCLLVDGRPVAARTVRLGGAALTEAVAKARGLPAAEAERVKAEEGLEGVQESGGAPVLDRLVREIVQSLGSFEPVLTRREAPGVDGLCLVGGGARLHGLDAHLGERVGLPAARLVPGDDPLGQALRAAGDPVLFGPALALALRGTARARTAADFRQEEFAARFELRRLGRRMRSTAALAVGAVLLAALLAGTSLWMQGRRAEALEGAMAERYARAFPGRPLPANALGALQNAVRDAQSRADFLGVYRGNLSALDLLGEIARRIPQDLDIVFEELAIDRQVVRIRGHTRSFEAVDRLSAELARFAPFSQIKVSEITSGREGNKSFNLTISLAPPEGAS